MVYVAPQHQQWTKSGGSPEREGGEGLFGRYSSLQIVYDIGWIHPNNNTHI